MGGGILGRRKERGEQAFVPGEFRVGGERGVKAANREALLTIESAGNGQNAPAAIEEHDVALVENRASGEPDDILENQQAVLTLRGEPGGRDRRQRDRRLSELPRQEAHVREEGAGEGERSGRREDPADVVGD